MAGKTKIRWWRILWAHLLLLSYLLFTYYAFNGWGYSCIGTLLIMFFAWLARKDSFLEMVGLRVSWRVILRSVLAAAVVVALAFLLINPVAARNQVIIRFSGVGDYYHDLFYVLNEEIVLGALVLHYLTRRRSMRPLTASVLLALVFSIFHFVAYKWIMADRGELGVLTLLTLFLVGFVRNSLILINGHVLYSWALHVGWVMVMLGSLHEQGGQLIRLTEPERFNPHCSFLGKKWIFSVHNQGIY